MKTSYFFFFILLLSVRLHSQEDLRVYKASGDRLMTNVTVQPGFTVYSLTKALGVSPSDFVVANPGLSTIALELNTAISLPINPEKISVDPITLSNPMKLTYTVGKGETLFSICNVYAGQNTAEILHLNGKTNPELSIGEEIILGYIDWPYGNTRPTFTVIPALHSPNPSIVVENSNELISLVSESEVVIKNLPTGNDVNVEIDPSEDISLSNNIMMTKGIAFWDNRTDSETDLVVMHPRAKVNSKIELYNPMLKRTVEATVVGDIPKNAYPHDANVIISPSVAEALGALDHRFLIEMTYIDKD